MTRIETNIITVALAVLCPWFTAVAFWWSSAVVGMYLITIPEGVIKAAALTGLVVGVTGDVVFLKRWVAAFYTAKWGWVAAVYLGLSILALAFFMGVPIGTFTVGIIGGVYLGRRLRHGGAERKDVSRTFSRGALVAGALTALLALPIGLLSLREPIVVRSAGWVGIEAQTVCGLAGQAAVVIFCLGLFIVQFLATRAAGWLAIGRAGLPHHQPIPSSARSAGVPPSPVN